MTDVVSENSNRDPIAKADFVDDAPIVSADFERVHPRQESTGTQRGERIIVGTLVLRNPNNQEQIVVGFGENNEFGIFGQQIENNDPAKTTLAWKIVGRTYYVYDPTTGKNSFQAGILPDGTGGAAGANDGYDVSEGF